MSFPGREELKRHVRQKYIQNCKPNTLKGTIEGMKRFLCFFEALGKDSVSQICREDLEAFVEHEQDRGMKPTTVSTRLRVVHAFVVFLIDEGIVPAEVLFRSIRVKVPDRLPKAIDPAEVKQLLSVLDDSRERAMILVLLRTGMRIGELLGTEVRNVSFNSQKIEIPTAPKTLVGRVVYLSDDALDALKGWFTERDKEQPFIFYGQRRGPLGYGQARHLFHKNLRKAGLEDKGHTLHCLRHTFASEMLNAGMRLECLQQLLGHTSIIATRVYARLTDVTREQEYFQAMEIIKKGGVHGHYQLDSELQAFLEKKKLLRPHRKAVPEQSETVSRVGRCTDRTDSSGEDL